MIVVADTSVVLNLCRVRHEHLLPDLFGRVIIPTEVASEFDRLAGTDARFAGLSLPGWVEILPSPPLPPIVSAANLDLGRTMAKSAEVDAQLQALTLEQVNAALRKYIDPAKFVVGVAGDFK